jgi:hypothetical protein
MQTLGTVRFMERVKNRPDLKTLSPNQKHYGRVVDKMETKLQLHQLGFNMAILKSIPQDIMDHHGASKDPKSNEQIREWAEEVKKYNRYMTEGTGNKPGDKNYSGSWEDNGVFPLTVKMAKEIGLPDRDIEEELTKGRNLASSLNPVLIGTWHPLSFRSVGGSGVLHRP